MRRSRGEERVIPAEIFELFPVLKTMLHRRGGDLSGGQQQQLAIARALVTRPRLLVLDEPTEGIQPSIIKDIGRAISYLRSKGEMAIVLVEQYFDFARELADRFAVMERGAIIMAGDQEGLRVPRCPQACLCLTVRASRGSVPALPAGPRARSARDSRVSGASRGSIDLYETGCSRLKFPRAEAGLPKACSINTAGGMTGGDEALWSYALDAGARVELTTQSAEKIYRSDGDPRRRCAFRSSSEARGPRLAAPGDHPVQRLRSLARALSTSTWRKAAQLTVLEISVFGRVARKASAWSIRGAFTTAGSSVGKGASYLPRASGSTATLRRSCVQPAVGGGAGAVATVAARFAECRAALDVRSKDTGARHVRMRRQRLERHAGRALRLADATAVRRDDAARCAARFLRAGLPRIWSV